MIPVDNLLEKIFMLMAFEQKNTDILIRFRSNILRFYLNIICMLST